MTWEQETRNSSLAGGTEVRKHPEREMSSASSVERLCCKKCRDAVLNTSKKQEMFQVQTYQRKVKIRAEHF